MAVSGVSPTPQAMCLNHPDAPATGFCSSCGKALCALCARQSFGTVLCDRCLEARQALATSAGVAEAAGSAPAGSRILRPLSYADLLDETFDLYKNYFVLLVGTYAVVSFPAAFLMNYSQVALQRATPTGTPAGGPNFATSAAELGVLAILFFFSFLFFIAAVLFSQGALTKAIADTYLGRATSIKQCYAFILRRFFSFLGTMMLAGLLTMAGTMLCCVGIFWGSFAASSFVVEGTNAIESTQRSMSLVQSNWLRCFVVFVLATILVYIVETIVVLPVQAITGGTGSLGLALVSLASSVAQCIVTPIQLIAGVLLYFDIRVRREGFDLQMLADRLTTSAATTV